MNVSDVVDPVGGTAAQKLVVLRVDPSRGEAAFELLGETQQPGGVRRSLRIDDALYAIGRGRIRAVELANPQNVLGELETGR